MRRFQFINLTEPPPLAPWGPIVVGFAAAVCAAYLANPVPRPHTLGLENAAFVAAEYLLVIVCAGGAAAWLSWFVFPVRYPDRSIAPRFLSVVACLAPVAVFFAEDSFWAVPATALLGVNAARLVRYGARSFSGGPFEGRGLDGRLPLRTPDASTLLQFLRPLSVAACAQIGLVSVCLGYWTVAAAMLFISSALLTWLYNGNGTWWSRLRREPTLRLFLLLGLLWTVTVGGMAPYLQAPQPGGAEGSPAGQPTVAGVIRSLVRSLLDLAGPSDGQDERVQQPFWLAFQKDTTTLLKSVFAGPPGAEPADAAGVNEPRSGGPAAASAVGIGERYPGIILHPESEQHVTIVPPLPTLGAGLFDADQPSRLKVPFFGVYWFFRQSDGRPPQDSIESQGDPASLGFSSVDSSPLGMEAHQNFGTLIDYRCCRAVQVAVRNADRRPGTVSLELILINTRLPQRPSVSLGRVPVLSTLRWMPQDRRPPVREVLNFPLPANSALRQFDEVGVRFWLRAPRQNKSAKIAIERFVFVP